MTSRQQQRQQERKFLKRGQAAISTGVDTKPQKEDILALAFTLTRTLRDTEDPDRASTAAGHIHALTEASTRRTPGAAKLACSRGCGYCCHSWVSATAPEIFLLAKSLRSRGETNPQLIPEIMASARPLIGLSPLQRFGAKLPCPLLVDNACSLYRERPTVCRQATSLELDGCIEEFEGRGRGTDIKISAIYLAHARNARTPLQAALRVVGLDARTYELAAGLTRALEFNNSEARWLAGDDVFAGVMRGPAEPAPIEQAIVTIVRELRGAA